MKLTITFRVALLLLLWPGAQIPAGQADDQTVRVVSWNISGDAFATHKESFRAIMQHTNPDVLVLDEVLPSTDAAQLRDALAGIDPLDDQPWNVDFGASGGRQRGVIASRWPITRSFVFSAITPYPEGPRQRIAARMTVQDHQWNRYSMEGGIPVNGAIVVVDGRRLMVVSVDLQCCGGEAEDWQEDRRQLEAREIRRLTSQELSLRKVDGTVIAGDLNSVATPYPEQLLPGPLKTPSLRLSSAEIFHLNSEATWTWDGRGTPFPSSILDYQLYSPGGLAVQGAYVFDTEDLDAGTLEALGLQAGTSNQLSRHRPLVVDYSWQ